MSVSSVFVVCFIPFTLVVPLWCHFGLLSMLNGCWTVSERDHPDCFLAEPVHNKRQIQGGAEMALLILPLNLTWAFQYANIFITTWPSGMKKVKMVLKHCFVYRMCIHIPSFAFLFWMTNTDYCHLLVSALFLSRRHTCLLAVDCSLCHVLRHNFLAQAQAMRGDNTSVFLSLVLWWWFCLPCALPDNVKKNVQKLYLTVRVTILYLI